MVSLRNVAVLVVLSLSAAVVSAFVPGGNPGGMAKAAAVKLEGGGTKTPIRAISHPRTNVKEIASVSNTEEFESLLGLARPKQVVAIWFHANWCRKCKYIGTRLKRLDEHLPAYLTNNLVVVSVDVNQVAQVPQRQKIKDLPTIQFFVDGGMVGSYVANDRGEAFYANMEKHLRVALGEDVE
ncbi:unnamed protein product [Ectocarpus sp. 12 AP-2014]